MAKRTKSKTNKRSAASEASPAAASSSVAAPKTNQPQYHKRRDRLKAILRKQGLKAMLVTNRHNVTYLSGFTGDSSYLIISPKLDLILTDTRFSEQIEDECPGLEMAVRDSSKSMNELISEHIGKAKISELAVEGNSVSKNIFDQLETALAPVELVCTSDLVEGLRAIKDAHEMVEIVHSIHLAERAFNAIKATLRMDQTEREIAHLLEHQIRLFGGVECAFEPIIAVGPRAALPHAVPTERRIEESPFVLIDWGARAGLYTSDLTRILVTGKISPKLQRIYGVVLKAQLAAIAQIRPGAIASEVDAAARKVIADAGHSKHFGHGLGHGFGLEIHENPRMGPTNHSTLEPGMVVTVEPGIYLPGWGGVRIEDDILVTKDGHEVLTSVTKDLEECVVF